MLSFLQIPLQTIDRDHNFVENLFIFYCIEYKILDTEHVWLFAFFAEAIELRAIIYLLTITITNCNNEWKHSRSVVQRNVCYIVVREFTCPNMHEVYIEQENFIYTTICILS